MDLKQAIMSRDDCTEEQAIELINQMKRLVKDGEDPEEVLYDEGFEPDYIFDIL